MQLQCDAAASAAKIANLSRRNCLCRGYDCERIRLRLGCRSYGCEAILSPRKSLHGPLSHSRRHRRRRSRYYYNRRHRLSLVAIFAQLELRYISVAWEEAARLA